MKSEQVKTTHVLTAYSRSVSELVRILAGHWRLLVALARRDLSEEYVGHAFSISWTIVHPLFLMLVYLFVFTKIFPTRIAAPPSHTTDAITYLLAGMIPWLVLAQVMGRSLTSVVGNTSIVKQMAFPLELLPVKTLAGPLVFGSISLVFVICYGVWMTGGSVLLPYLLALPVLMVLSLLLFTGLSLILACAQVFVRDLKEFVNLFTTAGLFIHPILYFPDAVPAAVRPLVYVSPVSYLIMCWQDALFYGSIERPWAWAITAAIAIFVFAFGARLFLVSKNSFGDFL